MRATNATFTVVVPSVPPGVEFVGDSDRMLLHGVKE